MKVGDHVYTKTSEFDGNDCYYSENDNGIIKKIYGNIALVKFYAQSQPILDDGEWYVSMEFLGAIT